MLKIRNFATWFYDMAEMNGRCKLLILISIVFFAYMDVFSSECKHSDMAFYDIVSDIYDGDDPCENNDISTDVDTTIIAGTAYYGQNGKVYTYSGEYTEKYVSFQGCDSMVYIHLSVVPEDDGIMDCQISIIGDTLFYLESQDTVITLTTDNEATYYHWRTVDNSDLSDIFNDTTIRSPEVKIYKKDYKTYILDSYYEGDNILFNGNFEEGNLGFSSDYTLKTSSFSYALGEGLYVIGEHPVDYHSNFSDCTNGGNLMIVNGAGVPNTILYSSKVNVESNTDYVISFEATNLTYAPLPKFQFSANDVQLGDIFEISNVNCEWNEYYEIWNSGEESILEISILNQNTALNGNNFAIDNIKIAKLCKVSDTITINAGKYYIDNINTEICMGESYTYNGIVLTKDTVISDTIIEETSVMDTIRNFILKVNETYDTVINASICSTEEYTLNNFHQNTEGIYIDSLQSYQGCDSIVTLQLTVYPVYNDTLEIVSCGLGYYDDNFSIEEDGFYTKQLVSQNGCDSVVNISFKTAEPFVDTIYSEVYKGDTVRLYDIVAFESGQYSAQFVTENGCDSTYILNLTVINFKFPNVITANGDGINDVFEIYDLLNETMFDETELFVYNRYGKQVFYKKNTHDKEDFWDPAKTNTPSGTYFYRFIARSSKKNIDFNGTVEVLTQ